MNAPPKLRAPSCPRTAVAATAKKQYRTPKLETYGSVTEITSAKGGIRADGGGRPSTKI